MVREAIKRHEKTKLGTAKKTKPGTVKYEFPASLKKAQTETLTFYWNFFHIIVKAIKKKLREKSENGKIPCSKKSKDNKKTIFVSLICNNLAHTTIFKIHQKWIADSLGLPTYIAFKDKKPLDVYRAIIEKICNKDR